MEDLRHEKQEIMKLLMLNSKSKLIGETNISKGTVNASLITPRELFIEALQKNAPCNEPVFPAWCRLTTWMIM